MHACVSGTRTADKDAKPILPFPDVYARASLLWFDGQFQATIDALDEAEPKTVVEQADKALLRSRALTRAKKFEEALEAASIPVSSLDEDRVATSFLLQSMALARMGKLEESTTCLGRISDLSSLHRTVQAEIHLQYAYIAYVRADFQASRRSLVHGLLKADDIVLARAQEMVGYVNVAEEKYAEAARSFQQAMATLSTSRHRDGQLELNIFCESAALATERLDTGNTEAFDAAYERLRWPEDIEGMRFQAEQNLGMLHYVAGNMDKAWTHLSAALQFTAKEPAYRLIAHANLMMLHRTLGETFSATQHLRAGAEFLSEVDWLEAHPNRRGALFEYLIEGARLGEAMDRTALEPLRSLPGGRSVRRQKGVDRRFQAVHLTALGNVLAQSSVDRGVATLNRALDAWLELGYRFRISTTAMDLYRLTRNPQYFEIAAAQTNASRAGFLKDELKTVHRLESRGIANLTRAERRILPAVIEGKNAAQIARESGRAEQTIKNQIRSLFARLGVKTRFELLKVCVEFGLTGTDSR